MVSEHLAERIAAELPGWRLQGSALTTRWAFPDFSAALAATVRVGMLAERADHHPDLELGWGYLVVNLTTHSAGGVTGKDLDLACAIQGLLGTPS
ncbi:MAG: 4a-hydroxytetrahydrobiopterin dehydratase [Thermoanaerobaculaceae bacterium]